MEKVKHFYMYYTQGFTEEQITLSCSTIFANWRDRMLAAAASTSTLKFALYSAHDTSLIAYILGLGIAVSDYPPFATSLVIELDERD
jgi:hypothetical protein